MNVWVLVIFMYAPNGDYIDKIGVPMTGTVQQNCRLDREGFWRYKRKLDGMDAVKTEAICVTEKHWRGLD